MLLLLLLRLFGLILIELLLLLLINLCFWQFALSGVEASFCVCSAVQLISDPAAAGKSEISEKIFLRGETSILDSQRLRNGKNV